MTATSIGSSRVLRLGTLTPGDLHVAMKEYSRDDTATVADHRRRVSSLATISLDPVSWIV